MEGPPSGGLILRGAAAVNDFGNISERFQFLISPRIVLRLPFDRMSPEIQYEKQ
jgi:hypothetical protein